MLRTLRSPLFYLAVVGLCAYGRAYGQTVTFTVTGAGNGSVTPVASWSTSPAGGSCVASGGWSGSKNALGSNVTLPAITSTTDYMLTCTWPGSAGSATVNWTTPTTNTDASTLTDLASYKVLYGTSTALGQSVSIADPAATSRQITGLAPGGWFFTVRAVNALGVESSNGNVVPKTIVGGAPLVVAKTQTVTVGKIPNPPGGIVVIETTAYNVVPDLQHFMFFAGSRIATVKLGSACDETRRTEDGFNVISRLTQVTPRPKAGTVLVAKCGA